MVGQAERNVNQQKCKVRRNQDDLAVPTVAAVYHVYDRRFHASIQHCQSFKEIQRLMNKTGGQIVKAASCRVCASRTAATVGTQITLNSSSPGCLNVMFSLGLDVGVQYLAAGRKGGTHRRVAEKSPSLRLCGEFPFFGCDAFPA